jgi:hypothetical protein
MRGIRYVIVGKENPAIEAPRSDTGLRVATSAEADPGRALGRAAAAFFLWNSF